ncbi:hypothetical protein [Streptomyces sp. V1I1]|uniref:hypothetical protein n=1 Tax=Streptomyces sp. V1I1 TaxID=3042272 RepID=UPI00277DA0C7|nr:hypothetical protein [Streptomyces sp. V1I1]MDQ0943318.1 hypothetical protein [Streptomyces sp. V1I1]
MKSIRAWLHRWLRPRILGGAYTGPIRVNVSSIPGGALVHLDHFLFYTVLELAEQFVEDRETVTQLLEEIRELSIVAREDSYEEHERDRLVDELLELTGGSYLHLYGKQVARVAELLLTADGSSTVVALPSQRGAGAA